MKVTLWYSVLRYFALSLFASQTQKGVQDEEDYQRMVEIASEIEDGDKRLSKSIDLYEKAKNEVANIRATSDSERIHIAESILKTMLSNIESMIVLRNDSVKEYNHSYELYNWERFKDMSNFPTQFEMLSEVVE